jgi:hypothetical protein
MNFTDASQVSESRCGFGRLPRHIQVEQPTQGDFSALLAQVLDSFFLFEKLIEFVCDLIREQQHGAAVVLTSVSSALVTLPLIFQETRHKP